MRRTELCHISSADGVQPGCLQLQSCTAFGAQLSSLRAAPRCLRGAKAVVDLVVAADHMLAQYERIAAASLGDDFGDDSLFKSAMVS